MLSRRSCSGAKQAACPAVFVAPHYLTSCPPHTVPCHSNKGSSRATAPRASLHAHRPLDTPRAAAASTRPGRHHHHHHYQCSNRGNIHYQQAHKGTWTGPHQEASEDEDEDEELAQGMDEDEGVSDEDEEHEGDMEEGYESDDGEYDSDGKGYKGEQGEGEEPAPTPGVSTGGQAWGEVALAAVRRVLADPVMAGLELYVFRTVVGRVEVRLDRMDHPYGSPSLDDITRFTRMLLAELEAAMGEEAAGQVSLEVSSPGADRTLRVPGDLMRFRALPMAVDYRGDGGEAVSQVLSLVGVDEGAGMSQWRLADVSANATAKGRKLSKRQRAVAIVIPLASITRAHIYIDF